MYLTEYCFRLLLQKLRKNQIKEIYRRGHSQLLELQFIIQYLRHITISIR
ncbi:hypothetical protein MNV_80051 [Candidatus Methanoperedens nitroreducens]|uniref:Uncharacterized protein n=1 Tax=Candidatus Methanoperedens nitratireducens TaxID=1392998 RepID=A0A284VTN8_9EURY|nr:hypothetical protein MNV_80051 [Candidatus Methanoperedens nitroreducens]